MFLGSIPIAAKSLSGVKNNVPGSSATAVAVLVVTLKAEGVSSPIRGKLSHTNVCVVDSM